MPDDNHFIDVSFLATPRMREINEILATLPDQDQRTKLVDMMQAEAEESMRVTMHPYRNRVKLVVVLGDGTEIEVGVYNQGVIVDTKNDLQVGAPMTLRDVATGDPIMRNHKGFWYTEAALPGEDPLELAFHRPAIMRFFIQAA